MRLAPHFQVKTLRLSRDGQIPRLVRRWKYKCWSPVIEEILKESHFLLFIHSFMPYNVFLYRIRLICINLRKILWKLLCNF